MAETAPLLAAMCDCVVNNGTAVNCVRSTTKKAGESGFPWLTLNLTGNFVSQRETVQMVRKNIQLRFRPVNKTTRS